MWPISCREGASSWGVCYGSWGSCRFWKNKYVHSKFVTLKCGKVENTATRLGRGSWWIKLLKITASPAFRRLVARPGRISSCTGYSRRARLATSINITNYKHFHSKIQNWWRSQPISVTWLIFGNVAWETKSSVQDEFHIMNYIEWGFASRSSSASAAYNKISIRDWKCSLRTVHYRVSRVRERVQWRESELDRPIEHEKWRQPLFRWRLSWTTRN